MKAGNGKHLIFRCAELLVLFYR